MQHASGDCQVEGRYEANVFVDFRAPLIRLGNARPQALPLPDRNKDMQQAAAQHDRRDMPVRDPQRFGRRQEIWKGE